MKPVKRVELVVDTLEVPHLLESLADININAYTLRVSIHEHCPCHQRSCSKALQRAGAHRDANGAVVAGDWATVDQSQ